MPLARRLDQNFHIQNAWDAAVNGILLNKRLSEHNLTARNGPSSFWAGSWSTDRPDSFAAFEHGER